MIGETYRIWLDDARAGCGWRLWVVTHVGRKLVKIFNVPMMLELTLPLEAMRGAQQLELKKKLVRKAIRANTRSYDEWGLGYSARAVERALGALA